MLGTPLLSSPSSFPQTPPGTVPAPGRDTGYKGPHAVGTERGPWLGDAQQPAAADLLLQHSTSGREGGKTGLLEPAALQGGGWELEEAGMGMRGLGSRSCSPQDCQKHCPGPLPDPDNPPPSPGSASPPLSRGEPGVRGGHGGSQLSACGETLPNPQRGGGGGNQRQKGPQGSKPPPPPLLGKGPSLEKGSAVGLGGGHKGLWGTSQHSPPARNREQTATQSADKAGAGTRVGKGSPWPGKAALGWERWPEAAGLFLAPLEAER